MIFRMSSALDTYFKISERGSSIAQEIRGGLVTFLTMAYIVVLNPLILGGVADADGKFLGGGTEPMSGALTIAATTALVAGILTILMGVVANFPLALATGLGLNAFLAYSVANDMTWADAMGLIVLEGLIILLLVLSGFRKAVFEAVPAQLKTAIAVGIGLFLTIIALVDAGFVRSTGDAAPPIGMGIGGNLSGWPVLVFCLGLLFMLALHVRKVPGAILIGITVTTVAAIIVEKITKTGPSFTESGPNPKGWNLTVPALPDNVFAMPDFSIIGSFNLFGSFERVGLVTASLLVFTLLLADFFDTLGTMTAVGAEAGLNTENGAPEGSQKILIVDSIAAAVGGAAGISSNTSYAESTSGAADGARTGLASVVTGVCFLIVTFFTPLVAIVPKEAAVAALVLVGYLMMTQIVEIDWKSPEISIPAFLTIVLMPFTYSVAAGIGAGFLAYVFLQVVAGKARTVHPLMWVVGVSFVFYFAIDPIARVLS